MAPFLWTQAQDIGPSPRMYHAMAFDGSAGSVLLFGGSGAGGNLGDTWRWDRSLWTQVADMGPSSRRAHAMAFDAARGQVILFGGRGGDGGVLGDTWAWDGGSWTQVDDSGPSARAAHAIAYDSTRQRIVLYGRVETGAETDTWTWDGSHWTQVADTGPSPRSAHVMTELPGAGRILLFGGASVGGAGLADTWSWDGDAWVAVADTGPAARLAAAAVGVGSEAYLFGGLPTMVGQALPFGDTWRWDGSHWTQVQDIGPQPRSGHALAVDEAAQALLVFGGLGSPGAAGPSLLGDTWQHRLVPAGAGPAAAGVNEVADLRFTAGTILDVGAPLAAGLRLSRQDQVPTEVLLHLHAGPVAQGPVLGPSPIVVPVSVTIPAGVTTYSFQVTLSAPFQPGTYTLAAITTGGSVVRSATFTVA